MTIRNQYLCVWCGIIFLLLFGVGWCVVAGFIPPPHPDATAEQIATFYRSGTWLIRLGLLMSLASCVFFIPWVAVISLQMKRIEGNYPLLSWVQLVSGTVAMLIILFPMMLWITVSFRPDRDPQLMLLLNDLGWLVFTMVFAPFVTQCLALALATFSDKSAQPVFPRWSGYYNVWVALLFVPTGLIVFFKTGPFAWNGVIGFWLPVANFGIWFLVMFKLLRNAIAQQAALDDSVG